MDVLKAMEADSKISIKELRVDGGATVNNLLMQFQADVLNTSTVRPKVIETTVMGAAYLAGLAVGFWESLEEIQEIWQTDVNFNPTTERSGIEENIKGWYRAIDAVEYWSKLNA
jgi:glycerol kinase